MSADPLPPAPPLSSILLVDDHDDVLQVWTLLLELYGYHVVTAAEGQAALALAQQHHPSLVITDWMMPVMDGLALCRAIRADEELKNTPIILWTAAGGPVDLSLADLTVRKPVSVEVLLSHITHLLNLP